MTGYLTEWLTDWLIPWKWDFLQKPIYLARQEFPRILWNPKFNYHVQNSLPIIAILSQINPVQSHLIFLKYFFFNIILQSAPRSHFFCTDKIMRISVFAFLSICNIRLPAVGRWVHTFLLSKFLSDLHVAFCKRSSSDRVMTMWTTYLTLFAQQQLWIYWPQELTEQTQILAKDLFFYICCKQNAIEIVLAS
jgi:hypothetical protein